MERAPGQNRAISWRVLSSAVEFIVPTMWDPGMNEHEWDSMVS